MCCEIWLVRHGETVDNASHRMQGQLPGKLSEIGKKQVQKLASRLQKESFRYIVVSDLGRAVESFDPLAKLGWSCEFNEMVREKHCGTMVGKPVGHVAKEALAAGVDLRTFRPPGGESWEDVAARAKAFLESVVERFAGGNSGSTRSSSAGLPKVLVITHGGFIKEAMNVALGQGREVAKNGFRNTSISILRAVPHGIKAESFRGRSPHFSSMSDVPSEVIGVFASGVLNTDAQPERAGSSCSDSFGPSRSACLQDIVDEKLQQTNTSITCRNSELPTRQVDDDNREIALDECVSRKRWSFNLVTKNDVLHLEDTLSSTQVYSTRVSNSSAVAGTADLHSHRRISQNSTKSRILTQSRPPRQLLRKEAFRGVGASCVGSMPRQSGPC